MSWLNPTTDEILAKLHRTIDRLVSRGEYCRDRAQSIEQYIHQLELSKTSLKLEGERATAIAAKIQDLLS